MTLGSKAIDRLKERGPLVGGGETLRIEVDGIGAECDLVAADSLGCSFDELRLQVPTRQSTESDALNRWADALTGRVTYLLEHLERLETDADLGTVLLRSAPPEKKPSQTLYYELLLQRAGRLRLRRYRNKSGRPRREGVPCTCTHEQLEKLLDDLVRSADQL